jgi:dipeptidyl aminopeptidase/acylaminoacyl peptidase
MQLFTAVQRKGIDSKMLIFPDEGHWVLKPQNSQLWFHTVLDWLDKYLQPQMNTDSGRSTAKQP